jgi:hypothetical protein
MKHGVGAIVRGMSLRDLCFVKYMACISLDDCVNITSELLGKGHTGRGRVDRSMGQRSRGQEHCVWTAHGYVCTDCGVCITREPARYQQLLTSLGILEALYVRTGTAFECDRGTLACSVRHGVRIVRHGTAEHGADWRQLCMVGRRHMAVFHEHHGSCSRNVVDAGFDANDHVDTDVWLRW